MSLVELVIALLLLAIVLVCLAGAVAAAQRSLARGAIIERITREAGTVLDSLAVHPAPAAGTRQTAHLHLAWTVTPDTLGGRLQLTATGHDGRRPVVLTFETRHAVPR